MTSNAQQTAQPQGYTDAIPCYPPGYKAKNWAPMYLERHELRALALGHAFLRGKKALNRTADTYFLANALVETPMRNFGIRSMDDYAHDPRHKDIWPSCNPNAYHSGEDLPRYIGCSYGMTFDYKTGTYADGVYRRKYGRSPTDRERIALWNGVGRSYVNGKLYGDASNHSRKVMEMQEVLREPENQLVLRSYRELGGFFP
jgi:hypothetical protein